MIKHPPYFLYSFSVYVYFIYGHTRVGLPLHGGLFVLLNEIIHRLSTLGGRGIKEEGSFYIKKDRKMTESPTTVNSTATN